MRNAVHSRRARGQVAQVVERSPEKAGVGGSTPSLATIIPKRLARVVPIAPVRSQSALKTRVESCLHNTVALKNLGRCESCAVRFQSARAGSVDEDRC